MNLLGQAIPRQRFLITGAAAVLTILLCFASYHEAIAGKGAAASGALKLLGKFAFDVIGGAATAFASDEVKKRIRPELKKSELEAAPRLEGPAQPASPPPQPIGYKFTLRWEIYGLSYEGTLVMQGYSWYGSFKK